ncbi:hypothetical protein IDJ81_13060 [Tsuneonella flava]|uniref:Uncharacterized protein n=1 Tax=Tsuneonella flava TaxID=2055955 RepID=A0ABX7K8D0_9SPHN|nr:hypothetical protein [Tsuneonella flava]QSB44239.1 hypothetical protein IDJ81_13060 [Tsuneonella flava]
MKLAVNMASKLSNKGDSGWTGRRIDLPELPRNAGENRTASKRVLLKAIKDAGGRR